MSKCSSSLYATWGVYHVNRFQFVPTARQLLGPVTRSGAAARLDDNYSTRGSADKTDTRRLSTLSRTRGAEPDSASSERQGVRQYNRYEHAESVLISSLREESIGTNENGRLRRPFVYTGPRLLVPTVPIGSSTLS